MRWVFCDDHVPMDHPSSQCDGKMEIPVSSMEGKGMNAALLGCCLVPVLNYF